MAMRANLVGEPGDAERRMAQNAGSETRLLDFGIAVHDAAHPAQVDVERTDRAPAHGNAGSRTIVGNSVNDLALILQPRIDDLDRRHNVFGGAQDLGKT